MKCSNPMGGRRFRLSYALVLFGMALVALAVAGCGGDSDTATSEGGSETEAAESDQAAAPEEGETASGYIYAGTEAESDEAREAGEEAAQKATEAPKGKTIGVIQLSGQSATSILITQSLEEIADMFGYQVNVCDPNFDPQKVPQCATSIMAQKPSVVFSVSQNPAPMGAGFKEAAQQEIPWFGSGSAVEDNPNMNDYGAPGFDLSAAINKYMFKVVDERFPDADPKEVLAIVAPTVGVASVNEQEQLQKEAGEREDIKVNEHDLDLENAVQDTLETSKQALEQNPDLTAMWTLCDFCAPLMAQVVKQVQGADRQTFVGSLYSNPEMIEAIRKGEADGVADYAWDLAAWVGMDQFLRSEARGEEIVPDFSVYETYPLPFMEPYVITQENVLKSGAAPIYGPDYRTFFTTKWAEEYGINP